MQTEVCALAKVFLLPSSLTLCVRTSGGHLTIANHGARLRFPSAFHSPPSSGVASVILHLKVVSERSCFSSKWLCNLIPDAARETLRRRHGFIALGIFFFSRLFHLSVAPSFRALPTTVRALAHTLV